MTGYARQIHPWFSWHRNFLFLYKYRFPESIRYLYYCEGFSCTSDPFNSDPHNTLHRSVGPTNPHRAFPKKRLKQAGRLAPTYPKAGYCFCANAPKPGRARKIELHRLLLVRFRQGTQRVRANFKTDRVDRFGVE
jgi:hypothetical protein